MIDKSKRMSKELVAIITALLDENKDLAKLLINNVDEPLAVISEIDNADFDYNSLIMKQVLPFPFDIGMTEQEGSEIRVFFGRGEIDVKGVIQDRAVVFDIIVAKSLWLITNKDDATFRAYDIFDNIISKMKDVSVQGVGRIVFKDFAPLMVNETFSGIRLMAEVTSIAS